MRQNKLQTLARVLAFVFALGLLAFGFGRIFSGSRVGEYHIAYDLGTEAPTLFTGPGLVKACSVDDLMREKSTGRLYVTDSLVPEAAQIDDCKT